MTASSLFKKKKRALNVFQYDGISKLNPLLMSMAKTQRNDTVSENMLL